MKGLDVEVIADRLAEIEERDLASGGHDPDSEAMCVMEAVSYVAGEEWSDHPQCACPVLTAFMVSWNDTLNDSDRQRLKPYIPRLVGTRSTPEVEARRSWMACDWLVRTFTPAWLRRTGLDEDAAALEALPELTATELVTAAMPTIEKAKARAAAAWDAVRAAVGDAAWAAARDAAWDAVWDAAGDAARAAAGDAAWAAVGDAAWAAARDAVRAAAWDAVWDAARDAAGDAVGDAARAAAGDAVRAALAPTISALQDSAFDLLEKMIAA